MIQSATVKYKQNVEPIQQNEITNTPGKKVTLDALFKSATATAATENQIQCSTPLQEKKFQNSNLTTPSNVEKTNNLKSLFGLSENNPPWEERKVKSQTPTRPPPGLEFPQETKPAIYSSSSSEDLKFKPTTLLETIANSMIELTNENKQTNFETNKQTSNFETNESDQSENQKNHSFAILDDENISGSCSESGTRPSPLARPNPRYLSRNLFGETPKLLSPAAFKPTVTASSAAASAPVASNPSIKSRRSSTNSSMSHQNESPIMIHREYLKQSLIALLEEDTDFLNKIHLAYLNQVKSKVG
jgi:hypothetical protein